MGQLCLKRTKSGTLQHLFYVPADDLERSLISAIPGMRPQGEGKPINMNLDRFLVNRLVDALNGKLAMDEDVALWYRQEVERYQEFMQVAHASDVTLPLEVTTRLRNYQRVGAHALATRKRMILADKQGLGKTLEALVATRLVKAERVLIVTLSIAKWQWQGEIRHWLGEEATVVEGTLAQRQAIIRAYQKGYLIIHYDILRDALDVPANKKTGTAAKDAKYPELVRKPWDEVILDEAHKLQNQKSRQSKAAEVISQSTSYVFELTGTPIWNMPDSLWHLLHILDPKVLSSYWTFVDTYCTSDETLWGRKITGLERAKEDELKERLSYYILQRTKEEVAPELPAKIQTTIPYRLSDRQWREYLRLKEELSLEYAMGTHYFSNAPAALIAMRRLCNNPRDLGLAYSSPKDDVLLDLVTNALQSEPKLAILCWHVDYSHHISSLLTSKGISHVFATGETQPTRRIKTIERYKQDDTRVLIGNIAAMGTALNLAEVTTAIFAELDWTPTNNEQAMDRFHRLTSTRTVNIYYLFAEHTVEEHIWQVTQKKSTLGDRALALRDIVNAVLQNT